MSAMDTRESVVYIHGNESRLSNNPTIESAIAWIGIYSQQIGDYCPRSGRLYIPHCYTKRDLYNMYKLELEDIPGEQPFVQVAYFGKLLAKHFPHLHMASKLMLGVCDECLHLSEVRRKCTNELEKAAYKQAHSQHLALQRAERIAYQTRKLMASTDPLSCWSIIIDYTDRYYCYCSIFFIFFLVLKTLLSGLRYHSMSLFQRVGFVLTDQR